MRHEDDGDAGGGARRRREHEALSPARPLYWEQLAFRVPHAEDAGDGSLLAGSKGRDAVDSTGAAGEMIGGLSSAESCDFADRSCCASRSGASSYGGHRGDSSYGDRRSDSSFGGRKSDCSCDRGYGSHSSGSSCSCGSRSGDSSYGSRIGSRR